MADFLQGMVRPMNESTSGVGGGWRRGDPLRADR
jgi:hypothetical protein